MLSLRKRSTNMQNLMVEQWASLGRSLFTTHGPSLDYYQATLELLNMDIQESTSQRNLRPSNITQRKKKLWKLSVPFRIS